MKNNKSLGQHWLKDRLFLDRIADSAKENLSEEIELCLEIGPGLGTLTSSLLKRFKKVLAVEFDENLAKNLPNSFPGKNLEVINLDFLQFDLSKIKESYVAVGNIPYYITAPIIKKLLSAKNKPKKIVLLVQKEVAEKLAALNENESSFSLFCKNLSDVSLGELIPKNFFTPPPKVDSRIIIFEPLPTPKIDPKIFDLISAGFSSPRKKLLKNLTGFKNLSRDTLIELFKKLNFDLDLRPANLKLEDWEKLANLLDLS